VHDKDTQHCNSKQTCHPGNRIVDTRSDARIAIIYSPQYGRRQRGNSDGDAHAQRYDSRKKRRPVASSNTLEGEDDKANGDNQRAGYKRKFRPIAIDKPTGPAREQEEQESEWKEGGAGSRRRVALYADEVER